MFGGLGIWELVVIFFIILLVFGAKRLPEIGGSLGKGIREFKDSFREVEDEFRGEITGSPERGGGESRERGEGTTAPGDAERNAAPGGAERNAAPSGAERNA